jgi:hypothetical protein
MRYPWLPVTQPKKDTRDTRCYTAEQLDRMQEQTQRDLEQSYIRPAYSTTPGKGILSQ